MPDVTITFTNVSAQTITKVADGLERNFGRLPGETDLQLFKRAVRIMVVERTNSGQRQIAQAAQITIDETALPD